jgi:hypothetical protein
MKFCFIRHKTTALTFDGFVKFRGDEQICRGEWPFAPTGILFSRTSLRDIANFIGVNGGGECPPRKEQCPLHPPPLPERESLSHIQRSQTALRATMQSLAIPQGIWHDTTSFFVVADQ